MARHVSYCILTTARIDGVPVLYLEWSKDPMALDALKRLIPARARTYDAERRRWRVQAVYREVLIALARTFQWAEWHEGNCVTDLRSGRVREQLELFEPERSEPWPKSPGNRSSVR